MSKETIIKEKTEADKIWEEISNVTLDLFALPNQKVSDHVEFLPVPGTTLYLKPKSSAVLPALETALVNKFVVSTNDGNKYITVKRVEPKVDIDEDFVIFQRPNGKIEKIPRNKF